MIINFLFKNLHTKQIVFKNTFWLAAAEAVSRFLKLILVICIARELGATEYGKFTFALSFVALFAVFSDFGLSSITTRELSKSKENENKYPTIFSLKIILSMGALILIIISSFFVTFDPIIQKIIRILAVYIITINFSEIIYAFFRARQKMEYEAFAKIFQSLLITGAGFFILFNFASISNLSLSYLFASLSTLICLLIFFHFRVFALRFALQESVWKKSLLFSWPIGLAAILGTFSTYISTIIMGHFHLITEIGWYNAAGKIISVLTIPSFLISQSFYPIISKAFGKSKEALQKAWNYQIEFKILFFIPLIIGATILAPKIISLVYGPNFIPSVLTLQILILGAGLIYINSVFSQILIVVNEQKKIILIATCTAIIIFILNLILIPQFSLYGAAMSVVVSSVLNFLLLLLFVLKFTHIKPFTFNFLLNFIGSLFAGVLMYFVISYPKIYSLNIFFSVTIGILVYSIFIFLYKKLVKIAISS